MPLFTKIFRLNLVCFLLIKPSHYEKNHTIHMVTSFVSATSFL